MQINSKKLQLLFKQLFSYFMVGGVSAIVEWVCFAIFVNICNIQYLLGTVLAFVFSTFTNWILGRIWAFKESNTYSNKRFKEAILVFCVSGLGLSFNMLLMYFFVSILYFDSPVEKSICKVIATGCVFVWNFVSRKLWIYK